MNPRLLDAIQDAQTLLAHAARAGISLEPGIVEKIVTTGTLCENKSITNAEESDFWGAFDALSKAVNPVTVSSLRATMDSHASDSAGIFWLNIKRGSLARRAVRWYTSIAILSLFVLLLIQIYWLFGTAITGDIIRINKDYDETLAKIAAYNATLPSTQAKRPIQIDSHAATGLDSLNDHKENLILEWRSSYNLLGIWSSIWERGHAVNAGCKENGQEDSWSISACERIARFQSAGQVLNILQRYILPLLYGLLGACVYILRTATSQIRARTYSESSNIDFRIRLYLGTLGGIVSAWFLTPEAAGGLFKSLSPFALAFLAGYSIELVFAAMDRIISAFTKPPEKTS